jgi:hypothetical protein
MGNHTFGVQRSAFSVMRLALRLKPSAFGLKPYALSFTPSAFSLDPIYLKLMKTFGGKRNNANGMTFLLSDGLFFTAF